MLSTSLQGEPGLEPRFFSWRTGLLGHFDVLHLHWPESRLRGSTRFRTMARQMLFTAILVRVRLLRRPIVRTVHNVELPRGLTLRERRILALCDRWTTLRIRMNEHTPIPVGCPSVTISHGHYRDWFRAFLRAEIVPGRLAFVGLIRRYKGVRLLTDAFHQTLPAHDQLTLHISGHPSSPELAEELRSAERDDGRISLQLERIDDATLVREVSEAELVVLPYPEMHNSGAVLTALSLDRPVLVPDNPVNRRLQAEVGEQWIQCYEAPLTGAELVAALAAVRAIPSSTPRPELDARDWRFGAAQHHAAYLQALTAVGRGERRALSMRRRVDR